MRNACLVVARFALCAWLGAAALFVAASVREQRSTELTPESKSHLAVLRFPLYYGFGFTLVGTALAAGALAGRPAAGSRRPRLSLLLIAAALVIMAADYAWIYRPLHEMMLAGGARPPRFAALHQASQYVNFAALGLCLAAALLLLRPDPTDRDTAPS